MTRKGRAKHGRGGRTAVPSAGVTELRWAGWFVFCLAVALYLNTLGHDFVFDDVTLILQNPQVTNLDWWGIIGRSGYRPVRTLTYALNYAISDGNPFSFHLFNVLLHGLNAVLVFVFIRRLLGSQVAGLLGAVVFAVHPVQTAAVAYISGRKDLLAAGFCLAGLVAFLRWKEGGKRRYAALAALAFLLGLLSKEVAIVFPLLVLLVDGYRMARDAREERGSDGGPWESQTQPSASTGLLDGVRRALAGAPLLYGFFALLAAAALAYALFIVKASRMEGYWGGSWETNLGTSFKLFIHYLRLAAVGYPLVADYLGDVFPVSSGLTEPATLAALAGFLGYGLAVLALQRKFPAVALGMLWFLIGLVPVLQWIPFHELAADHFLYLPMIGFALALAGALTRSGTRRPSRGTLLVLAAVVVVWSGMTVDRNWDWRDKQTLWEATLRRAPGSYRANANLGQLYFSQGRVKEAVRLSRRAAELMPDRALPHSNLGAIYYLLAQQYRRNGNYTQAEQMQMEAQRYLERALELDSENPFTCSNLGNTYKELALIYEATGRESLAPAARERAAELYAWALRMRDPRPERFRVWFNWGLLQYDAENYEGAIRHLRSYVQQFPDEPGGHYWYGMALARAGRYADALPQLLLGFEAAPESSKWETVLAVCEKAGRLDQAEMLARRWVAEAPSPAAFARLADYLGQQGRSDEARQWLDRCREEFRDAPGVEVCGAGSGGGRE
ncbi:MAG: hypothetical protein Kow00109_18220 [Acidobacteriota bacterium]